MYSTDVELQATLPTVTRMKSQTLPRRVASRRTRADLLAWTPISRQVPRRSRLAANSDTDNEAAGDCQHGRQGLRWLL